jgi:hypothetical protein
MDNLKKCAKQVSRARRRIASRVIARFPNANQIKALHDKK